MSLVNKQTVMGFDSSYVVFVLFFDEFSVLVISFTHSESGAVSVPMHGLFLHTYTQIAYSKVFITIYTPMSSRNFNGSLAEIIGIAVCGNRWNYACVF